MGLPLSGDSRPQPVKTPELEAVLGRVWLHSQEDPHAHRLRTALDAIGDGGEALAFFHSGPVAGARPPRSSRLMPGRGRASPSLGPSALPGPAVSAQAAGEGGACSPPAGALG